MVVGDEGALCWGVDEPVVPDRGGEGEESGGDAGVDPGNGPTAVVFEGELAFQRVEDGFDPLLDAAEAPEPGCLVFAVGADQVRAEIIGDEGLELAPGEPLVADDYLPRLDEMPILTQQSLGDFSFPELRVRQPPDHGHPLRGAEKVEVESPEEPRVGGAVPVAGVPGEVGAFHRLPRLPVGQRGRVDQPSEFTECGSIAGEFGDHRGQQPGGLADPFASPGLLRDRWEHAAQMGSGVSDPFAV